MYDGGNENEIKARTYMYSLPQQIPICPLSSVDSEMQGALDPLTNAHNGHPLASEPLRHKPLELREGGDREKVEGACLNKHCCKNTSTTWHI